MGNFKKKEKEKKKKMERAEEPKMTAEAGNILMQQLQIFQQQLHQQLEQHQQQQKALEAAFNELSLKVENQQAASASSTITATAFIFNE